ncbi:unnamed protein product [Oppiella nova]|uniref:NAD(P)-binding domain-containing protein n=1 Tax=Oppiella nova TaxID=334625 RepID=A0A7R9M5J9_9ACAR|nr:unnamed protein product [Oppiella nova]CAG2171056.1 unnamed protein product [Oppiella nova]
MAIKKVVIFGATGNTGLATVQSALNKGYEVTAFVRDPQKLPANIKPTHTVVGDATNRSDVDRALQGQEGVIVVLGTRNDLSATTALSDGTRNIVESMTAHNIQRIACCLSSFIFWERTKIPERILPVHTEHERMLEILKGSDRQWIAVCPPHIEDNPARGGYTLKLDGAVGRSITKYDLGDILVDSLTSDDKVGHLVGMGYA